MEPPEEPGIIEYPRQRVTRILRARLEAGKWPPGGKLPSVPALARELGAGHGTARAAIRTLRDGGWLQVLPRYGTFVSPRPPGKNDLSRQN